MDLSQSIIISLVVFSASVLTFYSGFGLGTILLPVFSLFFDIPIAIAMTAIVHLFNNSFKISFLFKNVNWNVILKFGITAIIGAVIGAYLIDYLSQGINQSNSLNSKNIKLIIGIMICVFAIIDFLPNLGKNIQINNSLLGVGGFLSGFFGGLSGHQGALRSLFLIKLNLETKSYIATGVFISIIIDISRLSIYSTSFGRVLTQNSVDFILLALLFSTLGVVVGIKLIKKVTIQYLQYLVAVFLLTFGLLMIFGQV